MEERQAAGGRESSEVIAAIRDKIGVINDLERIQFGEIQGGFDLYPGLVIRVYDRQSPGVPVGGVRIRAEIVVGIGVGGVRAVDMGIAPQQNFVRGKNIASRNQQTEQ